MTTQDRSRLNTLRRDLAVARSSVKLLQIDNERKTKELARLKSLMLAVARTCQ